MSSDHLLLGFDPREMWLDVSEDWPEERKRTYLLRQDIVKPLSTDTGVWPSVFECDQTLRRPSWTGFQNLWENLQALENFLSMDWHNRREPYWIIAITLLSGIMSVEQQEYWDAWTRGLTFPVCDSSWQLLGYDVSDSYLLSGLTNLGYGEDDVEAIGKRSISDLNEYHLFQSVELAVGFLPLANERARAHAPFFVFGIWLVKKEEGLADPL